MVGHAEFVAQLKADNQIAVMDSSYFRDTLQYVAYGSGGFAGYKEDTAEVREYAPNILVVSERDDGNLYGSALPVAVPLKIAGTTINGTLHGIN